LLPYTENMPGSQKGFAHLLVLFMLLLIGLSLGLILIQRPQQLNSKADELPVASVPVYRFYNPNTNMWTWSGIQNEINTLVSQGYTNQGILFNAYSAETHPAGTVPLMALDYHGDPPQTFMTTNEQEVSLFLNGATGAATDNAIWRLRADKLYVYPPTHPSANLLPVYRLLYYSPGNIYHGTRYYSIDQQEINALLTTGVYINEGIAFFGQSPVVGQRRILNAEPNPCVLGATGLCTSTISWSSGNDHH
jgi:hypothetical protein